MNAAVAIVGPGDPDHAARTRDVALANGLAYAGEFPAITLDDPGADRGAILAATDASWILIVEGDEELTSELAREIATRAEPSHDGGAACRVRIEMRFLDRRIVGGTFAARDEARLVGRDHLGAVGHTRREAPILLSPLRWRPFVDLEDGLARVDRETSAIALARAGRGERAWAFHFLFRPPYVLARELFARGGLRDGLPGFMLATLVAARELILYAKLWEQGLPPDLRQVPSNPAPP